MVCEWRFGLFMVLTSNIAIQQKESDKMSLYKEKLGGD